MTYHCSNCHDESGCPRCPQAEAVEVVEEQLAEARALSERWRNAAVSLAEAIGKHGDFDPETRVGRALAEVERLSSPLRTECGACNGMGFGRPLVVGENDIVEPTCAACGGTGARR